MNKIPVIAIFDVGKTNKKLFLFDENYKLLGEQTAKFTETKDEDGFPCDNLENIRLSVFNSLKKIFREKEVTVKAINFATYGASFAYIDHHGEPLTPLYNYLKPFPEELQTKFYDTYGKEEQLALETCSPVLGSLNSGMQLYRLKYEKPGIFEKIKYALHFPQYLGFILSRQAYSELTSIGCHTHLWDFKKNNYHDWVVKEGLQKKLAPVVPSGTVVRSAFEKKNFVVGVGLHDSSAALIPYLINFNEPFVLISTGTWCISLNPFNDTPLTRQELQYDCLCYLSYEGRPVKAARLFAGYEHEQQVKRIADYLNKKMARYKTVNYNAETIAGLAKRNPLQMKRTGHSIMKESGFSNRELASFADYEEAYHQLMLDLVELQVASTSHVIKGTRVKRIFVDGGFSRNNIYMNLLASVFPGMEIFAASVAQATSLGAALAIHKHWNSQPLPSDIIELKYYSAKQETINKKYLS
jgi:sugar (pentulose or hexulose) kinase